MIRLFGGNCSTGTGVGIPSLILFFLILLSFSLPALGIPSRSTGDKYNRQNPFPEKIFLNIDNGLLTLITKNSPLGPVMEEIRRKSGKKIGFSPILKSRKITVELKDIPFEEGIKKIAEDLGVIFLKDEPGNFYLSEEKSVPVLAEQFNQHIKKDMQPEVSGEIDQTKTGIVRQGNKSDISSEFSQMNDQKDGSNTLINEMVIRFKQGIPEEDIRSFLSGANIKVKKYIAALNYHILSLPDGMTYYDAIVLLKSNQMLYQTESNFLIPVK